MNIMLIDHNDYSNNKHSDYLYYVDGLRQRFSVRIQVKNNGDSSEEHTTTSEEILSYLRSRLSVEEWEVQRYAGYNGLHYIWFKNEEDAVAFSLKFAGIRT